ncbi:MAG: hypothetical protein KDC85_11740 [Saprospiraceae bacterium]|nr:hypothetical protein [Saprospiraceae bacterium]
MKTSHFLLFFMLISLFSCTNLTTETPEPENQNQVYNENPIRFSALEVGQKSAYVMLIGSNYSDSLNFDDFYYFNDTLIVEIISEDENGFLVEEYTTPGSVPLYNMSDTTYQYYLKVENDLLKVYHPDAQYGILSYLFWHSVDSLDLTPFTNQEIQIKGWKTSLEYCECDHFGYVQNYELFGMTYDYLNVSVRDFFMAVDGDGTTFVYSNTDGLVRTTSYSWWGQTGTGWDLLGSN